MREWLRKHSPLVVVTLVAIVATGLMVATSNPFITSLAGNVWGVVILLVAFDITPRDAQEKQERA